MQSSAATTSDSRAISIDRGSCAARAHARRQREAASTAAMPPSGSITSPLPDTTSTQPGRRRSALHRAGAARDRCAIHAPVPRQRGAPARARLRAASSRSISASASAAPPAKRRARVPCPRAVLLRAAFHLHGTHRHPPVAGHRNAPVAHDREHRRRAHARVRPSSLLRSRHRIACGRVVRARG